MDTRRISKSRRRTRRGGLKMTAEAEYSITRPKDSIKLLEAMKKVLKTTKDKSITDATANVGGDTTAFAKYFKEVQAIELKDDNFEALKENTKKFKNVKIYQGDSLELFKWKTDVLYIDAPWGGPEYKTKTNLDLYLGETRVDEWVNEILKRENRPSYIFLKVPFNYHFDRFKDYEKFKISKFYLLSINIFDFITLPKNTLLFRVVKEPLTDFVGPLVGEEHCLPKHYNVFFYTNPFAAEIFPEYLGDIKEVQVYKTTKEVKILSLVNPSKYTRMHHYGSSFLVTCSKHKGCLEGRKYDACLSDSFMKNNPDVSGWIGVSKNDGIKIKKSLETDLKDVEKYIHLLTDNNGSISSPEIALYPLQERQDELKIKNPEEWIKKQKFNYKKVVSLERDHQILKDYLDKHATLNEFYYVLT
jgi:hypothetical protein